jgi:hypothetical protein
VVPRERHDEIDVFLKELAQPGYVALSIAGMAHHGQLHPDRTGGVLDIGHIAVGRSGDGHLVLPIVDAVTARLAENLASYKRQLPRGKHLALGAEFKKMPCEKLLHLDVIADNRTVGAGDVIH